MENIQITKLGNCSFLIFKAVYFIIKTFTISYIVVTFLKKVNVYNCNSPKEKYALLQVCENLMLYYS